MDAKGFACTYSLETLDHHDRGRSPLDGASMMERPNQSHMPPPHTPHRATANRQPSVCRSPGQGGQLNAY